MSTQPSAGRSPDIRLVPWSPSERTRALLDAVARIHGGREAASIEHLAVDGIERALPAAAAALFARDPSSPVVTLRCAGMRWRTAEREQPAWLTPLTAAVSRLVRGDALVAGTLVTTDDLSGEIALVQAPVRVDGRVFGTLVVVWPGPAAGRDEDAWFVEQLALQLGLALRHAVTADRLQRSVASLRVAQRELVRSEQLRALGELACGVAHDFNNTLTTVLGIAEWHLHSAAIEGELRDDLETVRVAATDAASLVKRLHFFGRRGDPDERDLIELDGIAELSLDLVRPRIKEMLERHGRDIQVDVVRETDVPVVVRVNAVEMRELVVNLLLNAFDAMPAGGRVTIRIGCHEARAWLSVQDDGEGMTPEVLERVFEPFFSTKGRRGTGLGLSVSWGIASAHGGRLAVESRPSEGSTFTLWLPLAADDERVDASPPDGETIDAVPPLSVLLVDDQADVRQSLTDLLSALGHTVDPVPDGRRALELLGSTRYDVVITDLGMPEIDGIDVACGARREQPHAPVILLTGWGSRFDGPSPEGIRLVMEKPVTLDALRTAIARVASDARP